MSLTGTKKEAEARVTALVSPNGENEPALPGRRTPKPTAKRLAGSWEELEGDEYDEERPLATKKAKGSSGAAANSDLVTRAANAARVTELLSPRQPQGPEGHISPTPPKKPDDLAPFSIVDSLSHCSDYDVSDLEEGLVIRQPGQANALPELQGTSTPCRTCAPWLRRLSHRLSACEAELDKCRKKIKRVITPVNDAWIDALNLCYTVKLFRETATRRSFTNGWHGTMHPSFVLPPLHE